MQFICLKPLNKSRALYRIEGDPLDLTESFRLNINLFVRTFRASLQGNRVQVLFSIIDSYSEFLSDIQYFLSSPLVASGKLSFFSGITVAKSFVFLHYFGSLRVLLDFRRFLVL